MLIHSPLVGPYSWQPVAEQLEHAGHNAWVPSLQPVLDESANFADAIGRCVANVAENNSFPDNTVLVAHSAAGAYLSLRQNYLKKFRHIFLWMRVSPKGEQVWQIKMPHAK
jgi:hypothetical protein